MHLAREPGDPASVCRCLSVEGRQTASGTLRGHADDERGREVGSRRSTDEVAEQSSPRSGGGDGGKSASQGSLRDNPRFRHELTLTPSGLWKPQRGHLRVCAGAIGPKLEFLGLHHRYMVTRLPPSGTRFRSSTAASYFRRRRGATLNRLFLSTRRYAAALRLARGLAARGGHCPKLSSMRISADLARTADRRSMACRALRRLRSRA